MTRDAAAQYEAFAVAAPGLEDLVARELTELGVSPTAVIDGGVEFDANRRQLYEANLHLRTASRVLIRLAKFRALTFGELERRARKIPWEHVLSRGQRVALRVTCRKSKLYHSGAVAERLERDLVERLDADVTRSSPDEDVDRPEGGESQLIVVRLDHDRCTVSADSSGAHLHQRGYRISVTTAPMRETLAAAMILASEWDRTRPLVDPFCGSGTIPIEAALLAADIAPGKNRRFQFMQWPGHDPAEWRRLHAAALGAERVDAIPPISASDRNAAAIRAATENAERAGLAAHIRFERIDALRLEPDLPAGWLVCNPPYGVRLGSADESRALMADFGKRLRQRFPGWHLGLLASSHLQRVPGLTLAPVLRTTNGGLRVHVLAGKVPDAPDGATGKPADVP